VAPPPRTLRDGGRSDYYLPMTAVLPTAHGPIWTDADFDRLAFHDCTVHGFAADPETFRILLDLDYLLEWLEPVPPDQYFTFRVSPATLVFKSAVLERFEVGASQGRWSIDALNREDPKVLEAPDGRQYTQWKYIVDGHAGDLIVRATGFRLSLRRHEAPILSRSQSLTWAERGGCSFDER
jgi:hypothetical protein